MARTTSHRRDRATDRHHQVSVASGFDTIAIAARAYDLYLARNCEDGHDLDDWLEAERQLREPRTTADA